MKRMTLVTRSGDSRCFKCGSCPSCPPGLRPEGFLTTGLGAPGGFAEGGNDELEAFSPNRARSSRTSALSSAICRTKSAIMASRSTHPGQDRGSMTTAYKINPSSAAPVFQLSRMNGYELSSIAFKFPDADVAIVDSFVAVGSDKVPSGLLIQVATEAADIRASFERSRGWAAAALSLVSLSGRGAVSQAIPIWSYDVSPGVAHREWRLVVNDPILK